eukprot:scaffold66927_cov42-Phaeocystis_antarctica.AAC.3
MGHVWVAALSSWPPCSLSVCSAAPSAASSPSCLCMGTTAPCTPSDNDEPLFQEARSGVRSGSGLGSGLGSG